MSAPGRFQALSAADSRRAESTPLPAGRSRWRHVLAASASVRPRELGWCLLIGFLYGVIDLSGLQDLPSELLGPSVVARHVVVPMLAGVILLLAWLPADRTAPDAPGRVRHLATAAVLGTLLAVGSLTWALHVVNWPHMVELLRQHKGEPAQPWHWSEGLADVLSLLLFAGMAFAVVELARRRQRTEAATAQLLREHDAEVHQALAARLAAAQARLAPAVLFELLVDIEARFAGQDPQAVAQLERLIQHLRLSQPRLREGRTTLAAEGELLGSWLALMGGLQRAPWQLERLAPTELANRELPSMLLLPLLQQACQGLLPGQPLSVALDAQAGPDGGLLLCLALQGALQAPPADTQAALQAQMIVLAGPGARLRFDHRPDRTLCQLELPP